jgi:hypothetical protein
MCWVAGKSTYMQVFHTDSEPERSVNCLAFQNSLGLLQRNSNCSDIAGLVN